MYKSSLILTDMELEEVTTGEEETLRPQVREQSGSKKNFKKSHNRVSEDSVTAFENRVSAICVVSFGFLLLLGYSQSSLVNRGNSKQLRLNRIQSVT